MSLSLDIDWVNDAQARRAYALTLAVQCRDEGWLGEDVLGLAKDFDAYIRTGGGS